MGVADWTGGTIWTYALGGKNPRTTTANKRRYTVNTIKKLEGCIDDDRKFKTAKRLVTPLF